MLYCDLITKSVTNSETLDRIVKFQGEIVLKYTISYPNIQLNLECKSQSFINKAYRRAAQNAHKYIINNFYHKAVSLFSNTKNGDFMPLEILCEMCVMYENRGFFSVFFDTYEKIGDVVIKNSRHSDTWNLKIGKILPLGCFFDTGYDFKNMIFKEIFCQIEEESQLDHRKYFKNWREILYSCLNLQNFYLADDGFVFYFPEYALCTKKYGLPSFLLPFEIFGSHLKYDL